MSRRLDPDHDRLWPTGHPRDGEEHVHAAPGLSTPTQLAAMTRPCSPQPPMSKQNPDAACNGIEFDTIVLEYLNNSFYAKYCFLFTTDFVFPEYFFWARYHSPLHKHTPYFFTFILSLCFLLHGP